MKIIGGKRRWLGTAAMVMAFAAQPTGANHAWATYHWDRPIGFTLDLGDNVTSIWDGALIIAGATSYVQGTQIKAGDWSLDVWGDDGSATSNPVNTAVTAGRSNARRCDATAGRVEVCNYKYGSNGWLGIAQIWLSGDHITQGVVKLNDTYFSTATYNKPVWRALVMCQEIGHTLGLGHTDENQTNADTLDSKGRRTCMDYSNDPTGQEHPNQHDYDQLGIIYGGHTATGAAGGTTLPGKAADADGGLAPGEWGRAIGYTSDGRGHIFERNLGQGRRVVTHVFWVRENHKPGHD